jgi:hypothetical protein
VLLLELPQAICYTRLDHPLLVKVMVVLLLLLLLCVCPLCCCMLLCV